MFRFSSLKKNIDSLIAAAAGFFIIFLFTRHGGIGISPDSVVYLTAAENLQANGKLADFTKDALVDFPAFYSLFLSAVELLTGLKPLLFAPFLNALFFAILIYLSGNIMEQFTHRSKWYKSVVLSCIVLSPALLEDYSMLWSETLFILWLLLFMMAMHRYFHSYSRKALVAAAVIASIASITRYAGITVIAMGGILLLIDTKLPLRRKLTDLVLFSVISPLLLIINLVRNYVVSETLTGFREKSISTLASNTHDAGWVLCDWLPFLHGNHEAANWVAIGIIAVLAFICLEQFLHNGRMANYENMAAIFSLLYISFLIVIASVSRFETLNSRFLSPVFIPLLWSGSSWIVSISQRSNQVIKRSLMVLGTILFLTFQWNQLSADYETWDGVKDAGIPGYTEDQWTKSEAVKFIEKDSLPFRKNYTIYSDAPDAVYFFTGRQGKYLPHKDSDWDVQEFLNDPHCYMIWFTDGIDPDMVDMNFIAHVKKMKLLKQFSDGVIYEFDKNE